MLQVNRIAEIWRLFLKLGLTAFGGPAAHIAMMRDETVAKRKWLNDREFLDLVGATNLIPGPNSTELAIHIGKLRGGWKGFFAAGLCFILPAVAITVFFAWLYKSYGSLPQIAPFLYGIKPAIIAVIIAAIIPLAKTALKSRVLIFMGIAVLVLSLLGYSEILLMLGAGLVFALSGTAKRKKQLHEIAIAPIVALTSLVSNGSLFLTFLKIGSILYGSGYVLFAFLDTELVATGIISRQVLIDAIAVGQITPGPVFSSVAFIGYQINGLAGAAVSALGIFLPSFAFVALLSPLLKKIRNSNVLSDFLDAVNVASVAIIVSVCILMARESITDWRTILIAVVALGVTFSFPKVNTAWIVIGGSLGGWLLAMI